MSKETKFFSRNSHMIDFISFLIVMSEILDDSSLMMVNKSPCIEVYSCSNDCYYDEGQIMERVGAYLGIEVVSCFKEIETKKIYFIESNRRQISLPDKYKTVDSIRIYIGGNTGCQPIADIVYMVDSEKSEIIPIQWDVPDERNEVLKYLNGYTLIKDERQLPELIKNTGITAEALELKEKKNVIEKEKINIITGKIEFNGNEHPYLSQEERERILSDIGSTLKLGRYDIANSPLIDAGKLLYLYGTANAFDDKIEGKIAKLIEYAMKKLGIELPGELSKDNSSYSAFGYDTGIIPVVRDIFIKVLEEALDIIIEDAYKEF